MEIEMYMMTVVWGLTNLVCMFMLKRNFYKLYMKKENGRIQQAEIKKWGAKYYIRPTLYQIGIEYAEYGEKKRKTITTSSFFPEKYRNEKYIQIMTIPGTNFVFLEEEKWWVQNIELSIVIFILSIGIVPLLLMSFIMTWTMGKLQGIIFLSLLFLFLHMVHKACRRTKCRHKTRMKYTVNLSYEEVTERLRQAAHNGFQFDKEKEDINDKMYIFSIYDRAPFCRKHLCKIARYRVLVTPAQVGSAVWFFLSECSDDYALNRFAEKLGNFMEKKINAFRDE